MMTTTAVSHQRPGIVFMGRRGSFFTDLKLRALLVDSATNPDQHFAGAAVIPCVVRHRGHIDFLPRRWMVAIKFARIRLLA